MIDGERAAIASMGLPVQRDHGGRLLPRSKHGRMRVALAVYRR
ncbi:hypothetical protein [Burkholderia vietnamiensis]|nr:hypothetical protein [Burkholderia vietnamiensis]